jgi:hypothetical protein
MLSFADRQHQEAPCLTVPQHNGLSQYRKIPMPVCATFSSGAGCRPENLSSFVEEAVKWRILDQTIAEARDAFADMTPDELDALLEEAVAAARAPSSAG